MQKYADINRHTQFAKLGGKLMITNKRKRRTKSTNNIQIRLWVLIFCLIFICVFYIRYQALYVDNSVFRDLYKLIYQHFLSKDPLPPIDKNIVAENKNNLFQPDLTSKKVIDEENVLTDSSDIISSKSTKEDQKIYNDVNKVIVGTYHPYLDYTKDIIKFIVISKKLNLTVSQINNQSKNKIFQKIVSSLVNYQSKNKNIKNIFHGKTKLRNAWLENDTLILDFNRYFERSKYGYKGIDIRVQQILWTFLNLKNSSILDPVFYVSILINGERTERIGGDGYSLKPFYSKKDLRKKIYFP